MSKAAKALILTWVLIGLLVAGGAGFYLGRITAPKIPGQPSGMQTPDRLRDSQQLNGSQQPLQGGFGQQPQGQNKGGPAPSGQQGVQQNQPINGGQTIQ